MARIDVESSMWPARPESDMPAPTVLIPSQVGRIEERSDDAPAVRRPLHQGRRLPEQRFAWFGLLSEMDPATAAVAQGREPAPLGWKRHRTHHRPKSW